MSRKFISARFRPQRRDFEESRSARRKTNDEEDADLTDAVKIKIWPTVTGGGAEPTDDKSYIIEGG